MIDDETAVLVDEISGKPGFFGIERRYELEPVPSHIQVVLDQGFRELDLVERAETKFEFAVEFGEGTVTFAKPLAVFVDQGGKLDMLQRGAVQNEIAPVGLILSGQRHVPGERDLFERGISLLMDAVEREQVVIVFFTEELMPERSRLGTDGNEYEVDLVADEIAPFSDENGIAVRTADRESDLAPGVVIGAAGLVEFVQPVGETDPEETDERRIDIGPESVESGDLGVFEFKQVFEHGRVVIGFRPSGEEIFFRQGNRIPGRKIGIVSGIE